MSSESSDSGYLWIASTAVPSGISEVRLYRETWEHIREEHPEVETVGEMGVLQALQSPSQVFVSSTRPDRSVVFVSDNVTYRDNPLRVPVKRVDGTSGRVSTAYFSGSSYDGDLLWERDDDA